MCQLKLNYSGRGIAFGKQHGTKCAVSCGDLGGKLHQLRKLHVRGMQVILKVGCGAGAECFLSQLQPGV